MDKREQEFEEKIRQKLAGGSVDFDEGAWTKMEQRLDGRKGWVAMLPLWGRAAAIVLLAGLGFWIYKGYFSDGTTSPAETRSAMTEESGVGTESTAGNETSAKTAETPLAGTAGSATRETPLTSADPENEALPSDPSNEQLREETPDRTAVATIGYSDRREIPGMSRIGTLLEARWPSPATLNIVVILAEPDKQVGGGRQIMSDDEGNNQPVAANNEGVATDRVQSASERDGSGRDGVAFSLSVLAAPDLNGVGGFSGGKMGFNAGMGLGVHFNERLSLHTGIVYSKKPYNAAPSDYHTRYSPQGLMNIAARCEVIDIPLNLQYTLLEKGRSRLAVQAGLSSYLMLNEQYRYEFGNDDPRDYEYRNENQHWMGVGNAGLVLERELGNGLSLGLKPFVKVPLTGIGHGDVRLVSAGAALQLNLAIGKQKIYK